MPKSMRVKTRFEATENVSKSARKIEANTRRMNKSMQKGFRRSSRAALGFSDVMKGIMAAGLVQKGLGLLSQGLTEVTGQFFDFDEAVTQAGLKFKDVGPRADNFIQKLDEIKAAAREAGATTNFSAPQAANSILTMAKAGFTSAEAIGALNGQISFALASGEDFNLTTAVSTKLLGAFGLNVKDTEQKVKNLNRVNDVLTKTVNSSSIGIEDLFDAMKDVGPVARNLGSDINEVAAFAGVLGNSAIDGTKAMTGMRSLFLNSAAPTGKAAAVMESLGLTLDTGAIKAKNMTQFLEELGKATKGMSQPGRTKVFRAIFGKTGIAAATILVDDVKKVKAFKRSIIDARGEVQLMADVMEKTLTGRKKQLGSAATELGFSFLDPLEQGMKIRLDAITNLIRKASQIKKREPGAESLQEATNRITKNFEESLRQTTAPIRSAFQFGPKQQSAYEFNREFGDRAFFGELGSKISSTFSEAEFRPVNVDIQNNINAEGVSVDTQVKAPGTSGNIGVNRN